MSALTRNQETQMRTALGAQVAQRLLDLLNGQGGAGLVVPPLVNHTPPTYVTDANYSEAIDGVLVIYLPTAAVQNFWEVTLSLAPKHINVLCAERITHPKELVQFNSKEFDMVI